MALAGAKLALKAFAAQKKRAHRMWYVAQVATGQEERTLQLIRQHVGIGKGEVLEECFIPCYEVKKHVGGEWVVRTQPLFPGYLVVVTALVEDLEQALRAVPAFTKILGNNDMFIPLADGDIAWLDAFTQTNHRVVDMSEGIIEGDEIKITHGPLMNHVGWIKRIDRHKRLAYLEVQMFGRTIETKVGLEVVRKSV